MSSTANLLHNLPSLASIVDRQPLTVDPDTLLVEVISLMSQAKGRNCLLPVTDLAPTSAIPLEQSLRENIAPHHSAVLVLANDRLVGIFTERDLVKLTASQRSLQGVKVGEVMTTALQTLVLSDRHTVMSALTIFQQHQIRHLPILDDRQQLIGIVTPAHIRQILQPVNLLKFRSVAEVMVSEVVHAVPTTTILQIAQIMTERNISSIVIVDSQQPLQPVGIITEQDIVQFQTLELDLEQLLVGSVMSSPLFCLQPSDSLWSAQQIMASKQIRRLVITNNRGELAGILTQSNLLQLLDPLEMLSMLDSLQSQLIERATELEQTNQELQAEVARREQVEAELRRASQLLEARVIARTAELTLLTKELQVKIAEQEASDLALQISQQGISDFIENAPIGMHWLDFRAENLHEEEGMIVWANRVELEMLGYDREEYIGQPLINFHVDRAKIEDIFDRLLNNRPIKGYEAQMRRKDGSICDVSIDAHALFKNGIFVHARLFTRDISEQKNTETIAKGTLDSLQFQKYALDRSAIVATTDRDGTIIYVNEKFCEISQYLESELLGKTHRVINSGYHPPEFFRDLWRVISSGQVWIGEIKNRAKDGSYYWVATTIVPCFDENGRPFQYLSIRFDITDRKQIETELQASRSRYRALLITAPVSIYQTDPAGNILFVNQQCLELLELPLNEILGQDLAKAIHPDDRAAVLTNWNNALQTQQELTSEHRLVTPQGRVKWVFTKAIGIDDEAGNITGYIGTLTDITERKAAEQKILEQAALLNIATDAIIVRDLDSRIQFWNNGAESIYGWTAAEAVGMRAERLFCPDIPLEAVGAFNTVQQQGAWQGELHKLTKTGTEVIVESRWTLVRDEAGNPRSILSVDTDITAKKSLEQQFLRAQRLESLGSLASGIAHDLNNVLTPIVGAAQLLPMTLPDLDDRNRRLVNMLVESSKRGSGLVKQILTFARGMDGERTTLQVRHILTEIISVARQTFPKSIEIQVNHASEDLWMVSVDATQIHQVLMNLFVNARDAMPDGGSLMASSENMVIDADYAQLHLQSPAGAYILITIADTGIGMTSEMLDRIFEPFFTTKETGTGLGLSTVQGIVKAHGGAIEVESEVGRGTSFKIYLPAIYSKEAESSAAAADLYDGKGQLVLVVDDESAIREIAQAALENYNYRVMLASDGIEAIDIYAQNYRSIAIVLIDMSMPHLDTRSTIQALLQINPQVQIVVMSGSGFNLEAMEEREHVRVFLTKPFSTAEILQTLAGIQLE
jgi:PAS domain S-box-containing protein